MTDLTLTGGFGAGKFGQALVSGTANTPALPFPGTIECWAGTTSGNTSVALSTNNGWLGQNAGNILCSGNNSGGNVADGAPHHFAIVFGVQSTRFYVDGNQVGLLGASGGSAGRLGGLLGRDDTDWIGFLDEFAMWSGEQYTGNFTPPTQPYVGNEPNLIHLYHLNGNGTDSLGGPPTPTTQILARDTAGIFRAPYVWSDDGTSLNASNTNANLRFLLTGTSTFALNVVPLTGLGAYPVVRMYTDSTAPVDVVMTSGTTQIPFYQSGLSTGAHQVKIVEISAQDANGRWSEGNTLKITGFQVDVGGSISAPSGVYAPKTKFMIAYADSIGETQPFFDTTMGMLATLAEALGAELGQVAWAAQGFEVAGFGVPPLNTAYSLYTAGRSRLTAGLLSPACDYAVSWHGTNGNPQQSDVATFISNTRVIAPTAFILMIIPIGGQARGVITAAVAAAMNAGETRICLMDAGTLANFLTADGTHPLLPTVIRAGGIYIGQALLATQPRRFIPLPS